MHLLIRKRRQLTQQLTDEIDILLHHAMTYKNHGDFPFVNQRRTSSLWKQESDIINKRMNKINRDWEDKLLGNKNRTTSSVISALGLTYNNKAGNMTFQKSILTL